MFPLICPTCQEPLTFIAFIPLAELSQRLVVDASTRNRTWFFPQRMNNAVMPWAILNGSLAFLLFFLSYRFYGKKQGVDTARWGMQTTSGELGRTFLLALTLVGAYYLLLFVIIQYVTFALTGTVCYLPL